jgi:type IV pilus modification protein PilV
MVSNAKRAAGFTIPEVLVAVVILSVGILAMIGTSAATQKMIGRARRTTAATQISEGVLDSLRLKSNEDLQACTDLAANATGYSRQGVLVTWDVGSLVSAGTTGYREVRVIAQYNAVGRTFRDTLTTILKCDV